MHTDQLSKLLGRPVELASVPLTGRYPQSLLLWEISKGGTGLAVCLGMVLALQPSAWIAGPLLAVALLFALYGTQQAARLPLRFTVDEVGMTRVRGSQRTPFRWNELRELRLAYYPNGRKATMGMLVLKLRSATGHVKVDSTLDCFPTLLARAAQAARERQLELHPTTQANLEKLGL